MIARGFLRYLNIARKPVVLLASLLICQASPAQEPGADVSDALAEITVEQEPLPMEELTVVAPQSLSSMRSEIVDAENDVLALFNSLNDDNDYDIRCRKEVPLGSHISARTCTPRFADRETARAAQDFMFGLGYFDPTAQIRSYEVILREKMATLVAENPELYQAMLKYYQLKTGYDAERAERFKDGFFSR